MPHTPLRKLKPEPFQNDYETDSDNNDNDDTSDDDISGESINRQ